MRAGNVGRLPGRCVGRPEEEALDAAAGLGSYGGGGAGRVGGGGAPPLMALGPDRGGELVLAPRSCR